MLCPFSILLHHSVIYIFVPYENVERKSRYSVAHISVHIEKYTCQHILQSLKNGSFLTLCHRKVNFVMFTNLLCTHVFYSAVFR
jgi:hypothetical protein